MMPDGSWIKVENLKQILDYFRPKIYHPDDPRYKTMWQELRKRCVEGIWVEQFGAYRYVPGRLGFFGVFGRFEDWDENKNRIVTIPKVRDLEWHRAYYRLEADGFSGWKDDDRYTSDKLIHKVKKNDPVKIGDNRYQALFRKNGTFKEYIPARENIFMLHNEPVGVPLFYNDASNHLELGTRSGGKSYSAALMDILPDICFDGEKYFPSDVETKAVIEVTEGGGGKAVELLDKVKFGMDCFADPDYPELGVFSYSKNEIEPCPFYKMMTGSIKGNNKKNPWIHSFDVKIGNDWKDFGTSSRVYNTIYSANTKAGAQKSAGGRRTLVIHEEIGLNTQLIEAWGSNEGMISEGTKKMASQKGIGTSGDMETILAAKKIFTHPRDFNCLIFKYPEDPQGEYCFFIPSYMVDPAFKDEDGNTDVPAAYAAHKEKYDRIRQTSLPEVFLSHRMHFPLKIDDMWVQGMGELLPVREAEEREKELMKGNLYQSIGQVIDLYWDDGSPTGINYEFNKDVQPFYEWPLASDRKTLDSVFTMYIHPDKLKINGQIPNDVVFVVHDPYISEEMDKGGSLGVAYFIVNPKYAVHGLPGNCIAATIIGKHPRGTDGFNEQIEKGMHFYGNPVNGLWYEANRGDKVRSYFLKKRKLGLLCLRPQFEQGQFIFARDVKQTGYIVGNRVAKLALIDSLRDWLLEETELTINGETSIKKNIYRIPCIFTLRQIKQYTLDNNFDGVDALQALSLAVGEQEHRMINRSYQDSDKYRPFQNFVKRKMRV